MSTTLQKRKEECASLWKEAFGDSDEFIMQFITCYYKDDYMLYIEECNKIVSMLHIIPFEKNGCKVAYLYAVATEINARGKGYATALIEQAIEKCKREKYKAVFTLPADKELTTFYSKFGFQGKYAIKFETNDGFDFGTGDCKTDLAMMLPLCNNFIIPDGNEIILKYLFINEQ